MLTVTASIVHFSFVLPVHAQVQKCQDAQGKWHYGNDLRGICKNSSDIKSVNNTVKSVSSNQTESALDQELAQLELKVLDTTEYLNSDLKKILSPYNSKQDVEKRFDRLKSNTTAAIAEQMKTLEGLKVKENVIKSEGAASQQKNTVVLADLNLRIKAAEADLRNLTIKSEQIDKRRTKVLTLYDQFSDKFGPNAAS